MQYMLWNVGLLIRIIEDTAHIHFAIDADKDEKAF